VLFTGRSHVEEEVTKYLDELITMPVSPTEDDIRVYLGMRLNRDSKPDAVDNGLRRDVMRIIPELISEVCDNLGHFRNTYTGSSLTLVARFLLASLLVNNDAILGGIIIYKRRVKFVEMTKRKVLGDAYTVKQLEDG